MVKFNIIFARSKNEVIGVGDKLPWHLPEDLKMFKESTTDSVIIMGRKTYESIGCPLPNRCNIVITSKDGVVEENHLSLGDEFEKGKVVLVKTIEGAVVAATKAISKKEYKDTVWITGGSQIYQEFLKRDFVDGVKITDVNIEIDDENSVYFIFDDEKFERKSNEKFVSQNGLEYSISFYEKR